MFTKNRIAVALVAALCGASVAAQAETLSDFFKRSKIDGQIRSYYFSRDYGATGPNTFNQDAFSLGGMLNVQTAPFLGGFGVGVSFYTANALGANNLSGAPAYPHLDATLMGPRQSINALGQAYLQYALPKVLLIRAGDQVINTPWVNNSDSRILPATYQGVFAEVSPYCNWHLYGMRIFRWKSRTSSGYYRDNLYDPATFDGDSMYGGSGTPVITGASPATNGVLAFGTSGSLLGAKAQIWYYDYYQFAKNIYADVNYTLKTGSGLDPFVAAQFNREWQNQSLLDGSKINNSPIAATSVNSTAWGAQVGLNYAAFSHALGNGQLAWSYNEILAQPGAVGGGAIISPYTAGYATDPLYTTSMIRGLVELGPGSGWKVKWTQNLFDKRFLLMAAFAQYHTYYNGTSNDTYVDLTYFAPGMFKGLSIRDRVEVANGLNAYNGFQGNGAGFNKGHSFIYNRVMLTYAF